MQPEGKQSLKPEKEMKFWSWSLEQQKWMRTYAQGSKAYDSGPKISLWLTYFGFFFASNNSSVSFKYQRNAHL